MKKLLVYFILIGSLFFSTVSLSQNRTIIQFGNGEIKIIGYYSETLEVIPQGKENVQVNDIGYSIGGGGYIYIRIDPVGYKTIMQINIGYSSHRALTGKITVEPSGGGLGYELSQRIDTDSYMCKFGDINSNMSLMSGDAFTIGVKCTNNRASTKERITLQNIAIYWAN